MVDTTVINGGQTNLQNGREKIPQELYEYLENLITEANIPVYDEETKQQVIQDIFLRLDKFLIMKTAENMTEGDLDTLSKMNADGKSQQEIEDFIKAHVQNVEDIYAKALIDFHDFYITARDNFTEAQNAGNPR